MINAQIPDDVPATTPSAERAAALAAESARTHGKIVCVAFISPKNAPLYLRTFNAQPDGQSTASPPGRAPRQTYEVLYNALDIVDERLRPSPSNNGGGGGTTNSSGAGNMPLTTGMSRSHTGANVPPGSATFTGPSKSSAPGLGGGVSTSSLSSMASSTGPGAGPPLSASASTPSMLGASTPGGGGGAGASAGSMGSSAAGAAGSGASSATAASGANGASVGATRHYDDGFLGCLAVVGATALYGAVTQTRYRIVVAVRGAADVDALGAPVRAAMRRLREALVVALLNPMRVLDGPLRAPALDRAVADVVSTYV